jgi:hypothetical protein
MINEKKSIIVTTPKSEMEISAQEAKECIENGSGYYFRKLGKHRPTGIESGSKIYYVEDGYIRGFGEIASLTEMQQICESTNRSWNNGWFAIIPACTWKWIKPIPMTGFQGFRYFDDKNVEIVGNWLDSKPKITEDFS